MQQTILALAAILTFSYYALSSHRDDADLERRAIGAEIERALADATRNRMAEIERFAFDEQDVDAESVRMAPPTSAIGRDPGETAVVQFDDIDDFHDLAAVLGGPEIRVIPTGTGSVEFAVSVTVRYVNPLNPSVASAVPTMAKEVHVRAVEVVPGGRPTGRPPVAADFRRVYTPAGMAAFRRD